MLCKVYIVFLSNNVLMWDYIFIHCFKCYTLNLGFKKCVMNAYVDLCSITKSYKICYNMYIVHGDKLKKNQ